MKRKIILMVLVFAVNFYHSQVNYGDYLRYPNSYIFDPYENVNDGLYIPVTKAYAMWAVGSFVGNQPIPNGTLSADVLWEDTPGLIKSDVDYGLEIILDSTIELSKIKVPINKAKEGNAVIAFRVDGEIYWSWHVWVTDDPSNGSTYKSYPNVQRQRQNGTIENIPDSEWGWMDRNLGALSGSLTADDWNKNGGLLYQWGRKDPFPPLVTRGEDMYEVSGSIGRVRHRGALDFSLQTTDYIKFDDLIKTVQVSAATFANNIRLSVKNPLSIIYVNKNGTTGTANGNQAFYQDNPGLPYNWFGSTGTAANWSEINLWSDNSKGLYAGGSPARPYQNKSPYDPCPNGWRIPSALSANLAIDDTYLDKVRVDFSPFGVRTSTQYQTFLNNDYEKIKPTDAGSPDFMKGFMVYPNVGMDFSNVGGFDMGVFPGTGIIARAAHEGQYTDMHHTGLWTATMARHFDGTAPVQARGLFLISDKGTSRYEYYPLSLGYTYELSGCRCIKDPLYIVNNYNVEPEYFNDGSNYTLGLDNPNTYQKVKSAEEISIDIPVTKAFSVQNQLLNNPDILLPANYNNLKSNILWTDNQSLIKSIDVINPSPVSLDDLSDTNIQVIINSNQSGNAVVTLHNNSIENPVYWSWHIWITDSDIESQTYIYTTNSKDNSVINYMNYVTKGHILTTEFMDRNLGAKDAFPTIDPNLNLAQVRASGGFHYQWGRKDPLPTFENIDNRSSKDIFLGNVSGNSISYTPLTGTTYNDTSGNYIIPYDTYTDAANANVLPTDKINEKTSKVISYSVEKPLVYMVPSTFSTYAPNGQPNYTNGSDWLSTNSNLYSERWGRGGKKSPFDPCPEGWRIPDVTMLEVKATSGFNFFNEGFSPWSKKGLDPGVFYSISPTNYSGQAVTNSGFNVGYLFQNTDYKVGNYPNSGARGVRNVTANDPHGPSTYNFVNYSSPNIWMAALSPAFWGRPVSTGFFNNNYAPYVYSNDPYFGFSCRCVKIRHDEKGKEIGPLYPKELLTACVSTVTDIVASDVTTNSATFTITDDTSAEWKYKVSKFDGTVVQEGTTTDKILNISGLSEGTYYKILISANCSNPNFFQTEIIILTDADWCSGISFTDTGGETGNYGNNQDIVKTFYPQNSSQKLKITFSEFNIEPANDYMTIYDGTSTSAPVFLNGDMLNGNSIPGPFKATNSDGAITVRFVSNNTSETQGWKADFQCIDGTLSTDETADSGISIYLTVNKGLFTIVSKNPISSYEIYDASGRLVSKISNLNTKSQNVDLSKNLAGTYIVKVTTDKETAVRKIIKQ
ncbi:MAG: T9SS type A sorting domain-containing protein [Flavobacteriaceae bacterium]|nr:T9SS type A sorting domain-containing protein [Flavobacteriaceae bacterium]